MRKIRHFTLLEIALALTILAVLATLTGGLLFTVQQSWSRMHVQAERLERKMALESLADTAFRNMVPFYWPDENGKNRQIFVGERDRISFAYLCRINRAAESGLRFLELSFRDGALSARYRDTPWDEATPPVPELLLIGLERLEFEYASREGDFIVWHGEFDAVAAENIPLAIRVTATFADGDRVIYMRRTAGNGAHTVYGSYRAATEH